MCRAPCRGRCGWAAGSPLVPASSADLAFGLQGHGVASIIAAPAASCPAGSGVCGACYDPRMAQPRVYSTPAIVLRQRKLGDADKILTLYTARYGKLDAVAKGVSR